MECKRGEEGDKKRGRHLAVKLSISLVPSFPNSHTHTIFFIQVCCYGMLYPESPAHLTAKSDHALFTFFCTIFILSTVGPVLSITNTD